MIITLKMIRHGKTPANEEGRYLGRTDEELSEKGIAELKNIYGENSEAKPERVFVSPLKRCIQSADIIFGAPAKTVIGRFREMDFGEFEMKNYKELNGDPDYQAWIDGGGEGAFPGGESRAQFIARVMEGFEEMLEICKKERLENVAALVHGGTVMAVLSSLSGEDYFSFQVRNGEGYELRIDAEGTENGAKLLEYRRI